ncbi:MAG: cytochrome o ubiquinol oxidase subunit III [Verrucomicrobiota bacterium]|nr:cytochrome o ubiquinol oxidase subunit III [Verrucomicrobiota bacterium]
MTVHYTPPLTPDTRFPDPHQDMFARNILGFWIYLMTDCLIFATLFITHAILKAETFGGPSGRELFDLPYTFAETAALLLSSITCGFAILSSLQKKLKSVIAWLIVAFLCGALFVGLELHEFSSFVEQGASWARSAYLSSFFALVGTHGLHVSLGLTWLSVLIGQLLFYGITPFIFRRLVIFAMFWHFLDLVWIFLFTFVYLFGVLL